VWFFLKFIENDHFSWLKNAVNRKWWMRKWVVKKAKMRCNWIFDLKNDFFFFVFDQTSFLLRLQFCYSFCRFFFCLFEKSFLKLSWCRLCEILFRLFSKLSSLIVRCRSLSRSCSTKIRNRNVVRNVSNFWFKFVFHVRFRRWSFRVQSLQTFQCRVHDNKNVVDLSMKCRWLITANWFAFYVVLRQILEQTSIVVTFAQNDERHVAWMRKMLFLRKLMKQRKRQRSNEKSDLFVVRRQFD
jgi:hypothetical protein